MSNLLAVPAAQLHQELSDDELDCVVGGLARMQAAPDAPAAAADPPRVQIAALSLQTVPLGEAVLPC